VGGEGSPAVDVTYWGESESAKGEWERSLSASSYFSLESRKEKEGRGGHERAGKWIGDESHRGLKGGERPFD